LKYEELTEKLHDRLSFSLSHSNILEKFKKYIYKILNFLNYGKISAIKKINFFAPVIKKDYDLLRTALNGPFPQYTSWNYGNLEDHHLRDFYYKKVEGHNILVGNSATFTNNHIDAFKLMINNISTESKVIVPLSYGED